MPESLTIPLSQDLRAALDAAAREEGVPLDDFIRRALEAELESRQAHAFFKKMREDADFEAFDRLLHREGGEPPRPGDERC